jgi:serine/threonine protein kinase
MPDSQSNGNDNPQGTSDQKDGKASEEAARIEYLKRLRQILIKRFSEGELRTLCADLGIDYDDLPAEGKANTARELVSHLERRDRIPELVRIGKQRRSDIPWNNPLEGMQEAKTETQSPSPDTDGAAPQESDGGSDGSKLDICPQLQKKYPVERELGKGGGGHVYLARDKGLGRDVALKHRKVRTLEDQHQAERLLQEARAVASLSHPNVAIVYATERYPESGDYCVVMEYANGGSLADLLEVEGRLTLERALDIGIEVCTALEYVHRQGRVHGDIKPSNILFFQSDDHIVTKISDFGLSQSTQVAGPPPEGQEGAFSGTLEYAAPELLRGERPDGRIDLYSLGVVIYEMLIGEPPFPFSGDPAPVLAGHLHKDPSPPQEARPAVFDELNEVVLKALAKLSADRFQDAGTLLSALQTAREMCTEHHKQAEELYSKGAQLEKHQKWSEAVQAFKQAHILNPELRDGEQRLRDAELQLELETTWREAKTLLANEAWADALEQLGRISTLGRDYRVDEVRQETEYARLQLELASLYGKAREVEGAGQRLEAIRLYVDIVAKDDSYSDAARRLACLREEEDLDNLWAEAERLIEKREWEDAIKTYEQMLQMDPSHPEATRQRAYAQRRLELDLLYSQALAELTEENWGKAIKTLQDVIKIDPDYEDAAVWLAKLSREQQLTQLRQGAKGAIEAHHWSEAGNLLKDLLRWEPTDEEAHQQLEHVRQWRKFEDLYRAGKGDYQARQWDQAIAKFQDALRLADAAGLDLHNYRDIRSLMEQSRVEKKLDTLREEAQRLESAEDFNSLIQVLDRILKLDPTDREVREWKKSALQQIRLRDLYGEAVSRLDQRDWAGARRSLDEIASINAGYKDVQEKRTQVAMGRGVSLARRLGFPLAIALGIGLLVLFVPRLTTGTPQVLNLGGLLITPELLGAVVSVFALIVSIIGLLIPAEQMYELLVKHRRLRTLVILVVLMLVICLAVLLVIAFGSGKRGPILDPDNLRNGLFNEGFDYWETGGELNTAVECEAGQCFAVLGDLEYACDGGVPVGEAWVKQSFRVPDTVGPTVWLRYRVFSYDILSDDLERSDFFQVSVNGNSVGRFGNTEWNESACNREAWDSGWQSATFDLSPYQGERVELSFHVVNGADQWWNTWAYVDDVKIH